MILKNKKTQKLISSLVILAVLSPAFVGFIKPKKAEAFLDPVVAAFTKLTSIFTGKTAVETTISTGVLLKNVAKEVLRQTLMAVAKRALADITRSTVNWINTGYFGTPLFLESPESFFNDIAKSQIKDFITITGYDPNRFPFGRQNALNVIDAYNRQLEDNARYSLSYATSDPVYLYNYRANFNIGGWNGFLLHTQYPQNNPYGYQIEANRELARRLEGTYQAPGQEAQSLLQQGLGFLSPQVCPPSRNPNYDNSLGNAFSRPSFKFTEPYNPPNDPNWSENEYLEAQERYSEEWQQRKDAAYATWAETNECPGGLVNTTPGSVVGNQVMQALGARQNMTELQAALGGSLSAIFDAVINKFMGAGLNALASTLNKTPDPDTWDYEGYTLGGPSTSGDAFSGPDQEVVLEDFKKRLSGRTIVRENSVIVEDLARNATGQTVTTGTGTFVFSGTNGTVSITRNGTTTSGTYEYVQGDIENTMEELALMDNSDPSNYGLAQMFSLIWPKTRELDICIPGPDYGWEDRLQNEMDRNTTRLQTKMQDVNVQKSTWATFALKDLRFAVSSFKDWIITKMITELPSAIIFLDAVKEIEDLDSEVRTFNTRKRELTLSLARLKAIETSLIPFSTQPTPGSQQEKDLITIKKQYDAIASSISNSISIENTRASLDNAKNKFANLQKLIGQCTAERQTKGWSVPSGSGGWKDPVGITNVSVKSSAAGGVYFSAITVPKRLGKDYVGTTGPDNERVRWRVGPTTITGKEREQFCDIPIVSGYTHGENAVDPIGVTQKAGFTNWWSASPYPILDLPLVNGVHITPMLSGDKLPININISCKILYSGSVIDYKGSIQNAIMNYTPPIDPPLDPNDVIPLEEGGNTGTTVSCGGQGEPACS